MRLSHTFVMSMLFAVSAAACGDDGGKTGGTIDAPVVVPVDAATADAPAAPALGLGAFCDNTHQCPTTPAGLKCTALSAQATHGFCTISCGMTPVPPQGTNPTPPTGGNAICTGSVPAPGAGTPACVLTAQPVNNMIP